LSEDRTFAWRLAVVGLIFVGFALYMLFTGELAVDKQRTMFITRAGNPFLYWSMVLGCGTLGFLCLRNLWRQIRS
jgi:uncharacterized membrane protein